MGSLAVNCTLRASPPLALLLTLCLAPAAPCLPVDDPRPPVRPRPRILVLTHSAGFRHSVVTRPSDGALSLAETQFATACAPDLEVVCSQDAAVLTADNLASYRAVAFFTTGDLPVPESAREALLAYVRGGGGFVGIHSATDTYPGFPAYLAMLGGKFDGHPWHQRVRVRCEDRSHPSTAHLGEAFEVEEEIYQFKDWQRTGVHVLLSLDPASVDAHAKGVHRADSDFALAWCKDYGRGRVFYTALGHREEVWRNERFLRHVAGGASWAVGSAASPPASALAAAPPDPEDAGFVPLLDATHADGWLQAGPGGFEVRDGVATPHGGMGLFYYAKRSFASYHLKLEFQQQKVESNSGVFVRFPRVEGDPWKPVKEGYEVQIAGDSPSKHSTGAVYDFQAATAVPLRPPGEWNRFEIACVGRAIHVRLNSQLVNSFEGERSTAGMIGLQNHSDGDVVRFRNVRVKELPTNAEANLLLRGWGLPVLPEVEEPQAAGPLAPGLSAVYADADRRVTCVARSPNFELGPGESIHPALSPAFSAEWTGVLRVPATGSYTLYAEASVLLDGREAQGRPLELTAGDHALRIAFRRGDAAARLRLLWQSPALRDSRAQPIPARAFLHGENPGEEARAALAAEAKVERGRALVEDLNCVGCHRTVLCGDRLVRGRAAPDLTGAGSRLRARWLAAWLADPKRLRPESAMPALLAGQEVADVTAYLSGLVAPGAQPEEPPTDRFRRRQGQELFDRIGCAACHGAGASGLEGLGSKTNAGALARYLLDPTAIDTSGRMPSLALTSDEASLLAEFLTQSKNPALTGDPPPGDAGRGRALVRSRGCLGCHRLREASRLASTLAAPAFDALGARRGCLADAPAAPLPRFGLAVADRDAILAFLARPDRSLAPVHELAHRVNTLLCAACHELEGAPPPGVVDTPPPLTGAGERLRAVWMDDVLSRGKRVRPWMGLRMPQFGKEAVEGMASAFAASAGLGPGDERSSTRAPRPELVRAGVVLLGKGEGGLGCVSCHDFRGRASIGTRGPDLVEMAARLRPEWFRRWMKNPSVLRPGTAMPTFFADTPDAEAEEKIASLWECLRAGTGMPLPAGLGESRPDLLLVKDEPVVLRTFMPDASPRSIAVGFPGLVSICFDAGECRLRYAWFGDFLDVTPVWGGRGGEPARPLGERFFNAPDAFPLRIGDPDREPVRRFHGYRLVEKTPEFRYAVDGVEIAERITPLAGTAALGLVRRFDVGPTAADVWFLAGGAKALALSSTQGEWAGGGRLRIPASGASPAQPLRFEVTVSVKSGRDGR